jgi:phospholipid/cholesterol/gamma-HCH transport system substrate-binding protein
MRRRDEVLVGLLTLVAMAVMVTGMLWLARGGLSRGYPLYAKFEWGAGLKQGQPVLFSGVNVGYVDEVKLIENGGLVTTLRIYKKQRVPAGTVATVEANGIFGDMEIALRAKGPTHFMLAPGDTIRSAPGTAQIGDVIVRFDSLERAFIRLTNDVHAELIDKRGIASLREAVVAAGLMFKKLDSVATVQSAEFTKTQESFRHAANAIDSAKVDSTLREFRSAAKNFSVLMDSLKSTGAQMNAVIAKLEHGNGSMAKLVNDSTLYMNARNLVARFDSLLTDLKANPKKYLNVRVCIFGSCKN